MKPAIRIGLYYALLSWLYIVISDWAVNRVAHGNPEVMTGWQNLKGIAFVAGSAVIIFFLVLHYVRGRDRAQQQREEARKSFEHLFQVNPLPVLVYEVDSLRLLAVNRAASNEYGYSEAEFLARTLLDVHREEDAEKVRIHVARVRPFPYAGHWVNRRRDGSLVEMEIISHPLIFSGRESRLVVAVNIGTRRVTEQALADAFAAKMEADQAKTRFLSTISHEMRTPLNAITGFLDLLIKEPDSERRRDYAQTALRSSAKLLELIERLIQAADLSARRAAPVLKEIELRPFLRRTVEGFTHAAMHKNITLRTELAPDLPEKALLDATRLEETLQILLGNAIKFSNGGTVELIARLVVDGARAEVRLALSDEGIGIPSSQQARVFDSFFQVDQDFARQYGGVGLGLFVARQLCDLTGASIELESVDGMGSSFLVRLPGRLDEAGRFILEAPES